MSISYPDPPFEHGRHDFRLSNLASSKRKPASRPSHHLVLWFFLGGRLCSAYFGAEQCQGIFGVERELTHRLLPRTA